MKRLLLISCYLIGLFVLGGCQKEKSRSFPILSPLSIRGHELIYRFQSKSWHDFSRKAVLFDGGVGGIVLYLYSNSNGGKECLAYDAACVYEYPEKIITVKADKGEFVTCPKCQSQYIVNETAQGLATDASKAKGQRLHRYLAHFYTGGDWPSAGIIVQSY